MEICVCNDASSDNTVHLLNKWLKVFTNVGVRMIICQNMNDVPRGVGYARNTAISNSSGKYLCFQDIDDIMLPDRVLKQYSMAVTLIDNVIIGSRFKRLPENSTQRYTKWANNLNEQQLKMQVYTSHGPTIIMPTWFMHRKVFDR